MINQNGNSIFDLISEPKPNLLRKVAIVIMMFAVIVIGTTMHSTRPAIAETLADPVEGVPIVDADGTVTYYGTLKHGRVYKLWNKVSNNGTTLIGVKTVDVSYKEEYDYNGSSFFPSFSWTNWIANKNYILAPGESGVVVEADNNYPVIFHPPTTGYKNFLITYKIQYYSSSDGKKWNGPKYHTTHKYYKISFDENVLP